MKRVGIFLLLLILIGCSNNEEVGSTVEEMEKIAELQESVRELEQNLQSLTAENNKLKENNSNLENEIKRLTEANLKSQTLYTEEDNSFNPLTIEKGNQVAGLKVTNVEREVTNNELISYSISFNGSMQLEGNLMVDTAEGQGYIIQLSKEQMMQLPHTTEDLLNEYEHYVLIKNTEDFERLSGTTLDTMPMDKQFWIEAEFSDFTYNKIIDKAIFHTVYINNIITLKEL